MSCLLVVDDDVASARQLADCLKIALGGQDEIVCISSVSAYRAWRRQSHADLILVELMRHQSNGFSLAAALARQSKTPVVLLSDRRQVSDKHWANARGIAHVLSRHSGITILAQEIAVLLGRDLEVASTATSMLHANNNGSSIIDALSTDPLKALLTCMFEELQQCSFHQHGERWKVTNNQSDSSGRLKNLLNFIRQPALCDAIKALLSLNDATAAMTMRAREQVLFYLSPEPASVLRQVAGEVAEDIFQRLPSIKGLSQSSILKSSVHLLPCRQLLNALSFLPGAGEVRRVVTGAAVADMTLRDFLLQTLRLLADDTGASAQPGEFGGMIQVLVGLPVQPALADACLILTTLGAPQPCQLLLDACLAERYFLSGKYAPDTAGSMQEIEPWLAECLAVVGNKLASEEPVHQRLSQVMVSVYKLRTRLDIYAGQFAVGGTALRRWQMLATCIYQYCCHGVLRTIVLTEFDLKNLSAIVHDLQQCARQGVLPSDRVLINLAAAEICASGRSQSGDGQEHQALAAGLHRLPKPDTIVAGLLGDIRQSGSLMSEIGHELRLLTELAHRLGVERVESLSRLMQDSYQLLSAQPELLQQKDLRLVLSRAHRVLCRLLDQAAAWCPLNERGLETSVRDVINSLFLLFPEHHSQQPMLSGARPEMAAGQCVDQHAISARCHSINGRLIQLLRRRRNLEEYRSLMIELLREQHTLIATYLPYQPTD